MIEIILAEFCFSASHQLCFKDGSSNIHGHSWHLKVFVQAQNLDDMGMIMNYQILRTTIQEQIDQFDRAFLNDSPAFAGKNPTDEVIAMVLFQILSKKINTHELKISGVELWCSERRHIKYSQEVWKKDSQEHSFAC
ncbi:6-pyruvoyl tetrahydropterin synthase family protein [candidate division CSSED10-310 bacterium]|uniref:6-carboxy-5,6,7,8-tetrahydropterin synthase n=1 Tax=candidate division CSSED10-310 bacterium TaxID=2855610 RepID=A0ABV6Z4W6_UNCC1